MPVKMAPHQLAFWQELLSPFPDRLLSTTKRGGKELTYVDKRAITNRLDSVCGPNGWSIEYEATARGYKARLGILCPTFDGPWVWHYKEDGAGFEEMGQVNKTTQEFEYDVDNDEKSGYTNALRRAGQDAWGIGRYLYRKGIPTFLDPNASPFEDGPQDTPRSGHKPAQAPAQAAEVRTQAPEVRTQAPTAAPAPAPAADKPKYDNFKLPKAGKQVFAWCMEMSKTFECELKHGMGREGEARGWGSKFADWNQDQVNEICMTAIRHCRELPTYQGQYEHLFQGPGAVSPQPAEKHTGAPGVNIADLRRALMDKMKAILAKQLERAPTNAEVKSAFEQVASSSANGAGNTGEVPESLAGMTDVKWLGNMIAFVDNQIAQAVAVPASDDIPF